jgi:hypothetical protein
VVPFDSNDWLVRGSSVPRRAIAQTPSDDQGDRRGLAPSRQGYSIGMLYTILIVLAIVALLLFIFGRRRA